MRIIKMLIKDTSQYITKKYLFERKIVIDGICTLKIFIIHLIV